MQRPNRPTLTYLALAGAGLSAVGPASGAGRPYRGSDPWSVILCNFQGSAPPADKPATYYRDLVITPGTGGLQDYWNTVSYGSLNVDGSVVKGWYTLPLTWKQDSARGDRTQRFYDCIDAAKNSATDPYTVPAGQLVAVVTYPDIDMFGWGGHGAYLPSGVDVGGLGHELGHGLGFNHSFSDDPAYRNASWAQIGEYDDQWDVMSYANVFGTPTAHYGFGGPGLDAFHLDRMGWLPRPRIFRFGADGAKSGDVTLAALSHPEANGYLTVRIPFDVGDRFHYYTVEYRQRDGWDAGFPADTVLIHEVKQGADGQYYSYLLRQHSGSRDPLKSLNANGVGISVTSTAPAAHTATVHITSDMADHCLQGYVWREASPSDHVCVEPGTRDQAAADNAAAASRVDPNGAYGPQSCQQGYVWREAFDGDKACVTPEVRQKAADDDAAAGERMLASAAYGPNTCKDGYVWREADDRDWVCVTPANRDLARQQNAQAADRRNPGGGAYGPDTCKEGFVWRDAFPGDHVCVTTAERTQAANDNQAANGRLLAP